MSIRAITWAFEQKTGSPASKLVLIKLADNANDEGLCWPSHKYLAKHTELSRQSIINHTKKLAEKGFLKIIPRTKDGVNLPNHYQLYLDRVVKEIYNPVKDVDNGSQRDLQWVVNDVDKEPSIKPSLKSSKNNNSMKPKNGFTPNYKYFDRLKSSENPFYFDNTEVIFWKYLATFENTINKTHPRLKNDQVKEVLEIFTNHLEEKEEYESIETCMNRWFADKDRETDWNIIHFAKWLDGLEINEN